MKIHLDELEMAREYTRGHAFEDLSSEQTRLILDRGRELYKWFKAHPRTHALINVLVILSLFVFDFVALLQLPHWILRSGVQHSLGLVAVTAIVSGSLHSWFIYSIGIYS